MDKYSVLRKYFGYTSFRGGQEKIIDSILSGRDSLGIMPTGAGKSICYQLPAVMFQGITIVISPLISLMKDQVTNLNQTGIPTCFINSSQEFTEQIEVVNGIKRGNYKIVYAAPERLMTPFFLNLCQQIHISSITIDEAHCVSQWGQDFRPSYLEIPDFIKALPVRPVVSAFTATATSQVKSDICEMIGLENPEIVSTGFDRPNLYFSVKKSDNKFSDLLKIIKRHEENSGIVYCSTRKNVDMVSSRLQSLGIKALPYHAGLSEEERKENQDDFIYDRTQIIVATNAFGMGIDKSNVSFVVHYNMPKDLESYYQEAGRAGRDGSDAECTMLYSRRDYDINLFMIKKSYEEGELSDEVLKNNISKLKKMEKYAMTSYCLRHFMLDYFGENSPSCCNKCSNCNGKFQDFDATVHSQKILSCVYRAAQNKKAIGKTTLVNILRGSTAENIISKKLDKLSTYGIMKEEPSEKIKQITDQLIHMDYLGITDGNYPVLYLNKKAAEVMRGNEKVIIKLPVLKAEKLILHEKENVLTPEESELFSELKKLRFKYAERESVPAYVIFTNKTLEEMCVKKPVTIEQFENVSSVGKIRSEKYGEAFTSLIREFLDKKQKASV